MIEGLGKYVGGKVVSAVLALAVALMVIWYWRLPVQERAGIWSMARGAVLWMAFVAMLPWALFFIPARVVRAENNWISALTLAGYIGTDVAFALYLTGGRVGSTWQRGALAVGFLIAAVYNFAVCEFLAQRSEDSL